MNPFTNDCEPNYWLSCMIINKEAMTLNKKEDTSYSYHLIPGKTCPMEILDTFVRHNVEGRPIWKPMHMQPIYRMNGFVTREGNGRAKTNAYIAGEGIDVGVDLFNRGLCLPSDNKMTIEEQDRIIAIIRSCFE